jgi:hypothetical protein
MRPPRRRVPALVVLALGIAGALWVMHRPGVPEKRTISYDLGDGRGSDVGLTVAYHLGDELVRESTWSFEAGKAPERVTHEITVPPKDLLMTARITHVGGRITVVQRHLDAAEPGDVVVYLAAR